MWYELIPYFGVLTGVFIVSDFIGLPQNWLLHNNKLPKSAKFQQDSFCLARDRMLTGSMYKVKGLENLPEQK